MKHVGQMQGNSKACQMGTHLLTIQQRTEDCMEPSETIHSVCDGIYMSKSAQLCKQWESRSFGAGGHDSMRPLGCGANTSYPAQIQPLILLG